MAIIGRTGNLYKRSPLEVSINETSFSIATGMIQVNNLSIIYQETESTPISGESCLLGIEITIIGDVSNNESFKANPIGNLLFIEVESQPDEESIIETVDGAYYEARPTYYFTAKQINIIKNEDISLKAKCVPIEEKGEIRSINPNSKFKALAYCIKNKNGYDLYPYNVSPLIFFITSKNTPSSREYLLLSCRGSTCKAEIKRQKDKIAIY